MNDTLLLINIQNDCFSGGMLEQAGATEAVIRARKLLLAFRHRGMPIIHLQQISTQPDAVFFRPGTFGAELHASVHPNLGETVLQTFFPDAFRQTVLYDLLRKEKTDRLVVAGMTVHQSVAATVHHAIAHGFTCLVAHDACAACPLQFDGIDIPALLVHAACMAALQDTQAEIIRADELITRIDAFELKGN